MTRGRRAALVALAAALVVGGGCGGGAAPPPGGAQDVPAPIASGLRIGDAQGLAAATGTWAPVLEAASARAGPDPSAEAVARIDPLTPEGTRNIVAVMPGGTAGWVRVSVAALPNGTEGWVPRSVLGGYESVDTHLTVDLGARSATLRRDGTTLFSAPVGIGTADAPTPAGEFYVRSKLTRYASPAYGPIAFGTNARSPTLTDWPAGGFVGIHGTDRPDLLPGEVSHGCIRMRNADILRLADLMPVGTPLTVRGP